MAAPLVLLLHTSQNGALLNLLRPRRLTICRLVFLAKGGSWCPASHRLWPDGFRAAAKTVLLAARRDSGAGGGSCGLGVLPPDVLLKVLSLAAMPMSSWL